MYAVRKEDTGALFALKLVHKQRVASERSLSHLLMEREVAARIAQARSPFLCELRYAWVQHDYFALVMPLFAGGTLHVQLIERARPPSHKGLPVSEVRWLGAQIVLALDTLHHMGYLHRDIKPDNIMYKSTGYIVLTDFGLAAALHPTDERGRMQICSRTGTRGYWAPECVRKEPQCETADFWSLGVLLAYAATGLHPFKRIEMDARSPPPGQQVGKPDKTAPTSQQSAQKQHNMTDEELDHKTLNKDIEAVLVDPVGGALPKELHDLLARLLCRDPAARLGSVGANALRTHPFFAGRISWELLERESLPAPWKPDPSLVYAKDSVSGHGAQQHKDQGPEANAGLEGLAEWGYTSDAQSYSLELAEFASRVDIEDIVFAPDLAGNDQTTLYRRRVKRLMQWRDTFPPLTLAMAPEILRTISLASFGLIGVAIITILILFLVGPRGDGGEAKR